jgi:ubiquinone/menaquinone biosynthesis C-methylase UbiE/DNA-binding transcriptional ArsR family regulator
LPGTFGAFVAATLPFDQTIDLLRALAEPTRCRLLALLKAGELTVGEIAETLKQSQPRISRHLKVLSDVSALERFREEQRIYYRLTSAVQAADLVRQVLSHLDQNDAVLKADQARLKVVREQRVKLASADWQDVRRAAEATYSDAAIVKSVLKEMGDASFDQLLDVGTGSGSMLRVLGSRARQAVGLDLSTQALRVARARVHGAGLSHCLFKRGDMYELPFDAGSFDVVSFDQVLSAADKPAQALREAARVLKKGGRIIIVEDHERLQQLADDKPQVLLRRWLERAGLQCQKVKLMKFGKRQLWLGIGTR